MSYQDILGRELEIGNCVTVDSKVYKITRFTPKMVAVEGLTSKTKRPSYRKRELLKYASDLTLVPDDAVTMWLLKQG